MENWLKGLIAVACVVVIAAGSVYGWGEYQKASKRAEHRAEIETAKTAILNGSGERVGTPRAREWCEGIRTLARGKMKDNWVAQMRARQCRLVGL